MTSPAAQLIEEEEGRVKHAYQDQFGFWTIGVGHLIDGRKGGFIADAIIDQLLSDDIVEKTAFLGENAVYRALGAYRQAALVSMAFQLGEAGINEFHTMWSKLAQRDYAGAAAAALDSAWARETPARAWREAKMLELDTWVSKS
jgi:lysozyme